jgi:hypothetical protein
MADRSVFDGYSLTLYGADGSILGSWPAISGRPGNQRPSDQNLPFTGPLTEGRYSFASSDIQPMTTRNEMLGLVGKGGAPGSIAAWGTERAALTPDLAPTNGRNNFFIHGGFFPGSAGCIDLGPSEKAYFDALRSTGEPSHDVVVSYDPRLENSPPPLAGKFLWDGVGDYAARALNDVGRYIGDSLITPAGGASPSLSPSDLPGTDADGYSAPLQKQQTRRLVGQIVDEP